MKEQRPGGERRRYKVMHKSVHPRLGQDRMGGNAALLTHSWAGPENARAEQIVTDEA